MARKKPEGFMIYPEHVRVTQLLSDEERGRLLLALSDYAETGQEPEGASLPFMTCFNLMKSAIDRQQARYDATCERNRRNINKRWGRDDDTVVPAGIRSNTVVPAGIREDTVVPAGIREDTTYSNQTEQNRKKQNGAEEEQNRKKQNGAEEEQNRKKQNGAEEEQSRKKQNGAEEEQSRVLAFDGTDLTQTMEDYDRADDLIRRYRLPEGDISREALLEDAERVGWERLEDALKDAALSNSKPALSVRYYRAVLEGAGKPKKEGCYFTGYELF